MRNLLRYALSFVLAATWLVASVSTEALAQGAAASPAPVSAASIRVVYKQASSLLDEFDDAYCPECDEYECDVPRATERVQEILDRFAELEKQSQKAGIAADVDLFAILGAEYIRSRLKRELEYYKEDCGGLGIRSQFITSGYYYIPGTDTAIRIGALTRKPSIKITGDFGTLRRADFGSALQLENGGNVISGNFGYVSRKDDYQAFEVKGTIPSLSGSFDSYLFGYRFGTATAQSTMSSLSAGGGNGLNIYSPAGPTGGLGGGATVTAGNSDVTNLHYADYYGEHLGYIGLRFNTWSIKATGTSFSPYAKLFGGYVGESSNYSGVTNSGTLDFRYDNRLQTWRGGAELGGHIMQPICGMVGLYGDAAVRFVYNSTSVDSTLNFSGALNATESGSASGNKFDVGFVGGGGIYVQSGNATFSAGIAVETWQVPTLKFSNSSAVAVEYDDRLSVTGKIGLRLSF